MDHSFFVGCLHDAYIWLSFKRNLRIIASNRINCHHKKVVENSFIQYSYTIKILHIWAVTSEKRSSGFPTRFDIKRAVQPQKMARGFGISDLESRGLVLSKWRKQRRWSASRLPRSWSASLFSHMQKSGFLTSRLISKRLSSVRVSSVRVLSKELSDRKGGNDECYHY